MLVKKNFLTSVVLSISILTNSTIADGLNCSEGHCTVDVSRFAPSTNMKINKFKKGEEIKLTPLDKTIQVKENTLGLDKFHFESSKYVKQYNEILEPLTEEEQNTIIPAPEKFVATPEEIDELELIQPSLPMPLYYCLDNRDPIYDEKARQFNCIISG